MNAGALYEDRAQAGFRLAERLCHHRGAASALVIGIPKGGMPVAKAVGTALGLPIEALICRKLRCASDHALAAGALTETGACFINPDFPGDERLDAGHLEEQLEWARRAIGEDKSRWRAGRPAIPVRGRPVILVDDGVSTGSTIRAAIQALREQEASRIVLALPVAPSSVIAALRGEVDELVPLAAPAEFTSIGRYYNDWREVSDAEVAAALRAGNAAWRRLSGS